MNTRGNDVVTPVCVERFFEKLSDKEKEKDNEDDHIHTFFSKN